MAKFKKLKKKGRSKSRVWKTPKSSTRRSNSIKILSSSKENQEFLQIEEMTNSRPISQRKRSKNTNFDSDDELLDYDLLSSTRTCYQRDSSSKKGKEGYLSKFTRRVKRVKKAKDFLPPNMEDISGPNFIVVNGNRIYFEESTISTIVNIDLRKKLFI